MHLIDERSCECTTSATEWFQVQPTQTNVEKSVYVEYHPVTNISGGAPVEFYIPPSLHMDLAHSYLYCKATL